MNTNLRATRRDFLRAALAAPAAAPRSAWRPEMTWPAWMPRMAFSPEQQAPRGDTLIVVFLRGAADALSMVIPFGEESYYDNRPTLNIPRPDDLSASQTSRIVDLDGFFGFHPMLAPLMPAWQEGHLGIIHACGAPDESRSHFRAMELMERGVSDEHGPASGWIGRHLATLNTGNPSPMRAIGLGEMAPRSLQGAVPVSALRSITDFHLGGDARAASQMQAALGALYEGSGLIEVIGRETLDILDTLEALDPETYNPGSDVAYPETEFGDGMRQIAMLVRADVGLEVAAIDLGGWDTHFAQGNNDGLMAGLMSNLSHGLAALHADLFDHADRLTIVVMSEFGRRVRENASLGTDHGHGTLMFLLGGHVNGGEVHTDWPGLDSDQLFGPGDLAVTVDYRDVLSEVCRTRLNNEAVEEIFPDFRTTSYKFLR